MSTDIPPDIAIRCVNTEEKRASQIQNSCQKKLQTQNLVGKRQEKQLFLASLCVLFRLPRFAPVQTSSWVPLNPTHRATTCHCWLKKLILKLVLQRKEFTIQIPHLHAHSCIGSRFLTLLRGGSWSSKCVPQQEGSSSSVSQSILCRIPVINDNTPRPMPRVLITIFEAIPSTVKNPCQRWFNPWFNDLISRENMEKWWRMQEHTTNTYIISCFTSSQQSLQVIRSGLKCGPPNFCSLTAQSAISLLNAFKCSAHWIWEYWIALKFATNQDGTGQHALECRKNKMRFPPPCLIEEHAYIIPFSHKKMFPTRTSISIHIWHYAHLEHNVATWKLTCDNNLHQLLPSCFVCSINLFVWDPTLFRLQFQSTCFAHLHCDVFSIKKTHRISVDTRIVTR